MHIVDVFQGDEYRIHFSRICHQNEVIKSTLSGQGLDLKPTAGWHPRRQNEWIAGRQLIYQNIDEPINQLLVSATGKPYYKKSSYYFSISHSGELIGIGISKDEIGIDIQTRSHAIKKTSDKFISDEDIKAFPSDFDLEAIRHHIWTIKEAVFKSYGLGQVNFKNNINIISTQKNARINRVMALLKLENRKLLYKVDIWNISDYFIAVAIPQS